MEVLGQSQDRDAPQVGALNEKQAAAEYGVSTAWFQRKRWDGTGPRYLKIGRAVRYPRQELERFFGERLRASTSDTGGQ